METLPFVLRCAHLVACSVKMVQRAKHLLSAMKKIVLLLLIYSVSCQYNLQRRSKPERCHASTDMLYRQCCVFPPFFKREVAKLCGAKFAVMFINNNANVSGLRREANDPCEHWQCVLNKYALLTSENNLDDDKYFTHLDKWVALNPEFSTVMLNAKIGCKQQYRLYLPLTACEFSYLHSCIRNYVNVNCPVMMPTAECNELKLFYEECREFYT